MFKNPFQPKPSREELKQITSGLTPQERKELYRELGVSPSGVIDGVYNDEDLPDGWHIQRHGPGLGSGRVILIYKVRLGAQIHLHLSPFPSPSASSSDC